MKNNNKKKQNKTSDRNIIFARFFPLKNLQRSTYETICEVVTSRKGTADKYKE